ncbi:hypothetical protein OSB04_009523 [Centaurea solstitialis]|uniref:Replication protein A 70 kDa DNA-binding subunit B/D first OB fold domain-containing protein n=1 Tax=Centaurea solstitialis TaxID=347529 RepID=A0AA38T5T3_9ASTR|nr:hypothetical protein OSB04_009523 [Centaurea solstitialis]
MMMMIRKRENGEDEIFITIGRWRCDQWRRWEDDHKNSMILKALSTKFFITMSQDALNFIHEINTQNDCLKIKVRIVRIWKQSFSLDMILMDEKGKKIQGTIKAKLIHNFERFLAEGSIVVLSNFGVAENSGNYCIINHPCKLNFYHTTTVKKIEVFDGPVYGFGFVKFHDINNKKIGDEFAIG